MNEGEAQPSWGMGKYINHGLWSGKLGLQVTCANPPHPLTMLSSFSEDDSRSIWRPPAIFNPIVL